MRLPAQLATCELTLKHGELRTKRANGSRLGEPQAFNEHIDAVAVHQHEPLGAFINGQAVLNTSFEGDAYFGGGLSQRELF